MAAPPPKKGRLSLYEDLISDNARAEIKARDDQAAAAEAAKKKKDAPFMFKPTNLGKKPGNNAKGKPKPKPNFSNMHKVSSSTSTTTGDASAGLGSSDATQASGMSQKRGFEDWLANDDEEAGLYDRSWQNRNAKKSKKNSKKNKNAPQQQTWSYDDIYDPSAPVNITQYAKSEAAFQSREMWKMRLFNANKKERKRLGQTAKTRPTAKDFAPPANAMFAPPPDLSSFDDARPISSGSSPYRRHDSDHDYNDMPRATFSKPSFAPPASLAPTVANLNRDETAEEAYARRLALSSGGAVPPVAPSPPAPQQQPVPVKTATPEELEKRAKAAQQIAALKAKMAAKVAAAAPLPSPTPAPALPAPAPVPTPVLSDSKQTFVPAVAPEPAPEQLQPFTQEDVDACQAELKRLKRLHSDSRDQQSSSEVPVISDQLGSMSSSRGPTPDDVISAKFAPAPTISGAPTYNPNYPGIAHHMSARIATETPPSAPVVKETPAAEENEGSSNRPGQPAFAERLLRKMGWEKGQGLGASNDGITTAIVMKADKRKRVPGSNSGHTPAMGKIVGGHKKKTADSADDTPHGNMSDVIKLEGMLKDLDVDLEIRDNNLMQEIGDHMAEYGKVERVFIWRGHMGGNEEVFVKFTSQLSALNAVKGMDGVEFAGNMVTGRFWDGGKFERGEYE